jgi:hypothetical protein
MTAGDSVSVAVPSPSGRLRGYGFVIAACVSALLFARPRTLVAVGSAQGGRAEERYA